MISVIICSVNLEDLQKVTINVAETIGVEHEIIVFDNRVAGRGICEVYNEGIAKAKYGILCFMHEDITLLTANWGKNVLDTFQQDQQIGVVGVAGGGYKALAPTGWYCLEFENPHISFQNIIQGYKRTDIEDVHAFHNPYNERLSEVVCVDGVWFCARKEVTQMHGFDEKLLRGFHGYDLDFCLNIFGKHKIVVTYDVLMRHESEGN
ncbi:MAG TPA: glycosyltransferase, partial [Dyadobacter sp.]|nr:glycosyltransferase [Dyadobacter sp.]